MTRPQSLGDSERELLLEPIKVRRRNRLMRPRLWLLALLVLLAVACLLRVALISLPVFSLKAGDPRDGWKILRGAFHLHGTLNNADVSAEVLSDAFQSGLQFIVMAEEEYDLARRKIPPDAPLPVVICQSLDTAWGRVLVTGLDRHVEKEETRRVDLFAFLRASGGWSVLARVHEPSTPDPKTDEFDAIEFMNAAEQTSSPGVLERLGQWTARLIGSDFAWMYLAYRPVENLKRWDRASELRRVIGLCGLDAAHESQALMKNLSTYVLVPDGPGPHRSQEIAEALIAGRHFCGLPFLGDPSGFRFQARQTALGTIVGTMGDRVRLDQGLELVANLNLPEDPGVLTLRLFLNGDEVLSRRGTILRYPVTRPGAYRLEVGIDVPGIPLGTRERRFLYSNPIFLVE